MSDFQFHNTKYLVLKRGASSAELAERISSLGCKAPLFVTDPGVLKAGLLDRVLRRMSTAGLNATIYSGVEADPREQVILDAVDAAKSAMCDCVVGFGGGSSMDVAKLVALLAYGREGLSDIYGVGLVKGPRLPLILVPTTAGTGSEVTPISIVTTGEDEKKGVVSPVLIPDVALLDAELTVGLPSHITAATGIDAMVHAIEALTSKRLKNPISDCLAREALRLLSSGIYEACNNGANVEAREKMLLGASLAGMAFANAPVAGVHALAYPVGAKFHVPHGLSNSLVLPAVIRFNSISAAPLYSEICEIVCPGSRESESDRPKRLVTYLGSLAQELGLPTRLRDVGISIGDLPGLASDAMKQTRLLVNNPREITHSDAAALYEEVL